MPATFFPFYYMKIGKNISCLASVGKTKWPYCHGASAKGWVMAQVILWPGHQLSGGEMSSYSQNHLTVDSVQGSATGTAASEPS